jgi:hypothetical protein
LGAATWTCFQLGSSSAPRETVRIPRSFIDGGREGLFARDIANSFLRVVTSAEERTAIGGLIVEIEQPARRLPVAPSPGYGTFLGEQTHYEQSLVGGRIRLENRAVNGVRSLVIGRIPIV